MVNLLVSPIPLRYTITLMVTSEQVTHEPKSLLRGILYSRQEKNPQYSLRAFARDLGVSHAYLSMVFNGQLKLSAKNALKFSQVLDLNEEVSKALLKGTLEEPSEKRGKGQQESKIKRAPFFFLEIDQFKLFSEWHHFAILDLTTLKGFQPNTAWIAKRLGISKNEVSTAVKRLERLRLLRRNGKRWEKTHEHLAIPTSKSHQAMRQLHSNLINLALETLALDKKRDYERRDISGAMFAINSKRLPQAKKKIEKFRRQLLQYLSKGECDELYQLNVQLFSLTRGKK